MSREPLTEVKFRRPKSITKHGLPSSPSASAVSKPYRVQFCNMSAYEMIVICDYCFIGFISKTFAGLG